MSVMGAGAAGHTGAAPHAERAHPEPRVRELAGEAIALMAFSAGISVAVALLLLLAHGLGR